MVKEQAMVWTIWLTIGSLFGATSVLLGAFAAHGLKDRLTPYYLDILETGVKYQMYHALALLAVAAVATRIESTPLQVAGISFTLGTLLFSGSLYGMVFTGIKSLGIITPIGGVALVVGWLALAISTWRG
jgi:uncharacterized membrane protein YgdD (TMEM256/DUF423 family)